MFNAFDGINSIILDLKPTISKKGQSAKTSGRTLNKLSEQKKIFRFLNLPKSAGNFTKRFDERSNNSKVSANSKISTGNISRFSEIFKETIPLSSPLTNCFNVCTAANNLCWAKLGLYKYFLHIKEQIIAIDVKGTISSMFWSSVPLYLQSFWG
ncbi:hypothetical protein [Pedobacter frigidisoli]|uniref:hypothetical protein n=1 Tax=Pedobacter frigidisoli TaxID=2530455 RepID=UPI001CECB967|nr:hypothetical protein [Pedobacter frigidisoli]